MPQWVQIAVAKKLVRELATSTLRAAHHDRMPQYHRHSAPSASSVSSAAPARYGPNGMMRFRDPLAFADACGRVRTRAAP